MKGDIILIMLLAFPGVVAADDENYEERVETQYGAWKAITTIDTFEETPIHWTAVHPHGSYGAVKVGCDTDGDMFIHAEADNIFVNTIGSVIHQDRPIQVKLKVDDNSVVSTSGEYPNSLAQHSTDTILDALASGSDKAKIRTTHDDEEHTFSLSLNGFNNALSWVKRKCGKE